MENMLGAIHKFKVLRETQIGYMLTISGDDEYFLHKNETDFKSLNDGDIVEGFLYSDKKSRIAATLHLPEITTTTAGFAKVVDVNRELGVFVDIGISKDILVSRDDLPITYSEWPKVGDVLLCTLRVKGERLIAKTLTKEEIIKLNKGIDLPINEKVLGYVYRVTTDGINIVTESYDIIFVFKSNMRKQYRIGEVANAKVIRKNSNDYSGTLIEQKEDMIEEDSNKILQYLENNDGIMAITEKSDSAVILKVFNMSKKSFKNALGHLYKQRLIEIHDDKIILL